jgi:uncharacterized protein (DUF488 family)
MAFSRGPPARDVCIISSLMVIYTIGHSTHSLDDFIALLNAHAVTRLADVRSVPRSRRHPHFSADALAESLAAVDVTYHHFPALGGLRKPQRDSPNMAWRHEGFRGYADYMRTPAFDRALEELMAWAREDAGPERPGLRDVRRGDLSGPPRVVIMCAEAVWWRCHRQLIADALVARGVEVRHVTSHAAPAAHELTDFAHVVDGRVQYPGLIDGQGQA